MRVYIYHFIYDTFIRDIEFREQGMRPENLARELRR